MATKSGQLPQATAHLLDLNKMTEDGTMEVMRLTEIVQDNRARAAKELAAIVSTLEAVDCRTLAARLGKATNELAQDEKHLMDIMTALSFQDLVAQRVKKLVTIIEEVQCKLVELVVVFGLKEESATPETQGKAGEMLRQLEAQNPRRSSRTWRMNCCPNSDSNSVLLSVRSHGFVCFIRLDEASLMNQLD